MKKIFTPIQVGPMWLKNRMVGAPSVTYNAAPTGEVTQKQVDMYAERARGGFGFIQVEAATIRDDGCAFPCFLSIDHPKFLPGLSQLVEVVHLYGAKIGIQLIHTGRNAQKEFIGRAPVAPSDIRPWRDKPHVLTTAECEEIIGLYAKSAGMAAQIGFDAVCFHGALGHLPAQFLSPFTNDRTDKYGERTRFVVEMIQACREAVGPNVALVYRGSVDEFVKGGLTIEDWKEIAPVLEAAGIDLLDVYPGIFESVVKATLPLYLPEGFYVPFAAALKEVVNIPVMVVGKLMNPKLAEKVIEDGRADLVSYTRPMFADPHFPRKMVEGRYDDIRKCCGCDRCVGDGFSGRMTECSINASFQREQVFRIDRPAPVSKTVMVAGGGVGGMEAARVAAQRGHKVLLYEKSSRLGGLIRTVSGMPSLYMRELDYVVQFLETQLKKLGVEVITGCEVTADLVEEVAPDVLFIATGSATGKAEIPGADGDNVIAMVDDYLAKRAPVGERVAVIGGMHGTELAVSLAKESKQVTLIDEVENNIATAPYIVYTVVRQIALFEFIHEHGVVPRTGVKIKEITGEGVVVAGADGREELIAADTVILALPRVASKGLSAAVKERFGSTEQIRGSDASPYMGITLQINGKTATLFEIGDCVEPRTMKEAVHGGAYLARQI